MNEKPFSKIRDWTMPFTEAGITASKGTKLDKKVGSRFSLVRGFLIRTDRTSYPKIISLRELERTLLKSRFFSWELGFGSKQPIELTVNRWNKVQIAYQGSISARRQRSSMEWRLVVLMQHFQYLHYCWKHFAMRTQGKGMKFCSYQQSLRPWCFDGG